MQLLPSNMTWFCRLALACACLLGGTVVAGAHGDLETRIGQLSLQLSQDAACAELWLERAELRRQHGEWPAALADADEALRLRPDWAAAHLQRARILLDLDDSVAAQRAATACLDLDPGNPDALVVRSRCRVKLADVLGAIQDLDRVLVDRGTPLPGLFLERARLQFGAGQTRQALEGLDAGMLRLGETPSLAIPALEYQRKLGDLDATLARLKKLERFMSRESFLALKGEILLEAGRCSEATEVFHEALAGLGHASSPMLRSPRMKTELQSRLLAGLEAATDASQTANRSPISKP